MDTLADLRARFLQVCDERGIDRQLPVTVVPLSADQAIGERACQEFALKKGKEWVIEAAFGDARGQAFTDQPSDWEGSLGQLLALDMADVRQRAILVAGMNTALRSVEEATGTAHCRNEDPQRCGPVVAEAMESRFGRKRLGLIGLQPAILKSLVEHFGPEEVRVLDLNPENIGTTKCGVTVWDGATDLPKLVDWCEVGLATGSSIVNGTIDETRQRFQDAGKPVVFFGITIAGAAALLGIDRICPYGL